MAFLRTKASLLPLFLPLLLLPLYVSNAALELHRQPISDGVRGDGMLQWRRSVTEDPSSLQLLADNTSFVLAAGRTYRKDPLNGYQYYTGGWNLSDEHYLASVAFNALPFFTIAIAWFVGFGLVLLLICCCYCCCRRKNYSYSRGAYALSLILLIMFTCAAIIGCIVLYDGQGKFHGSTSTTLDYIVGQANLTVDNLRNFSNNLDAAKKIGVEQIFLPADIQGKIDELETKLNASANQLSTRTSDNSKKIRNVLDSVRLDLIVIAAVMLLLAFLGFLFSVLGMQFLVSILVIIGWILVAGTFILCGIFLIFHNVVADTCIAMEEWIDNPHTQTALDDILPCVDVATANESLYRSKEVTFQLADLVNKVILNISNGNIPPGMVPFYYNQSGPLMPILCNPYAADMSNHTCVDGEVDFNNAPQAWQNYICNTSVVSGLEMCTTVGRITSTIYGQMIAAVSVSHALYYYSPFLVGLEDCTFVRDTFNSISTNNCPGLGKYSKWIYIGLTIVSAAVMLSLIFWVIYARERRHRKYNKQFLSRSVLQPQPLQL